MKKKLVLMVLVVALALGSAFALVACGGDSSKDSGSGDSSSSESAASGVVGEWTLSGAKAGGQDLDESALGSFQYSYTFKDDGKASLNVAGQEYADVDYTFADNTVTFGDPALSAITLKLEGDQLVFEDGAGTQLFFKK